MFIHMYIMIYINGATQVRMHKTYVYIFVVQSQSLYNKQNDKIMQTHIIPTIHFSSLRNQ